MMIEFFDTGEEKFKGSKNDYFITPWFDTEPVLDIPSLVAELSRKGWDAVFLGKAGDVVPDGGLFESVRNRRIRNLAFSYWCGMVGDN